MATRRRSARRVGPWVLVTDDVTGQNRAALATVRALARGGYRPAVTVSGRRSIAAASRFCDRVVRVPPAGRDGYADALCREAAHGGFLSVLPASDVALTALGDPSAELVDKARLALRARAVGVPVLPDRVFASATDLRAAADDLDYPVVVKSVVKSGAGTLQALRADSAADLDGVEGSGGGLMVQPFEGAPMRAVSGVVWDGELLAVCHQRYIRIWPPTAGVACAAETVTGDPEVEESVLRVLAGHRGVFQAQFLGGFLLDVNPRVYGSLPLAVAAGANLPVIACEAAAGRRQGLVRARAGVHFRWLEGDVRRLLRDARTRDLTPALAARELLPRPGTAHSTESLFDPGPLLARVAFAADARRGRRST